MKPIFFRVDASVSSGVGHVMRCLTLAYELRARGFLVRFISRLSPGNMCDYIEGTGFSVSRLNESLSYDQDATGTIEIIQSLAPNGAFVILDSYLLGFSWESEVRSAGNQLMVLDDLECQKHDCDILLNQNFRNDLQNSYNNLVPAKARLLLGPHYALIRKEFSDLRASSIARRKKPRKKNIMVCMGGTDPDNDTAVVIIGFLKSTIIENIKLHVVVGSGNPNKQVLKDLGGRHKNISLHIQTPHMAALMTEADLAITAGGTITWERCVLGLPALVVVQSADQFSSTEALNRLGAHILLGYASDVSSEDYLESFLKITCSDLLFMSEVSKDVCDGDGAARVSETIVNLLKKQENIHDSKVRI